MYLSFRKTRNSYYKDFDIWPLHLNISYSGYSEKRYINSLIELSDFTL